MVEVAVTLPEAERVAVAAAELEGAGERVAVSEPEAVAVDEGEGEAVALVVDAGEGEHAPETTSMTTSPFLRACPAALAKNGSAPPGPSAAVASVRPHQFDPSAV